MANEITTVNITVAFKKKKPGMSFVNKVICWWTKSKYYHVELIIGNKWISSNPDVGGVTINDLQPLNDNWDYCALKPIEITTEQSTKILTWINSQSDKKYDWSGIIHSMVFPFGMHDNNKWFCSEICTAILKLYLQEEVLQVQPNTVSPGGLAKLLNFE